ncbi:hypothetical protein FB45DRAFT_887435 [Roridomyces roridus]|uniref:Uncharacterized protein n=1 Tax=Roridomyces roridus TaxID=1738132 RepID=A0AAD7CIZ4_9AGAR|nr:hypothetical protein FB45DRAFT_887435 [Roridomyces roridus]
MGSRVRRDAILLLVGASCFYLFSAFVSESRSASPSIIIDDDTNLNFALQTVTETVTKTELSAPQATASSLDLGVVQDLPETSIVAHAPGWTIFRNIYMAKGALLILTPDSERSTFPEFRLMTSTGLPGNLTNDPERIPTDRDMAFISPEEARARWGVEKGSGGRNRVSTVEGTTLLFNDPSQFLNHFHFVAELMFGSWAFLYGAFADGTLSDRPASTPYPDPSFNSPFISTTTPKIDRAIFIHTDVDGWRDAPGFNGYFMRAVFPSLTVEVRKDWMDRVNATTNTHLERAWHFPLVLLTDRSASFRGPVCGWYTQRTSAEAWTEMALHGKIDLIGNWWASMRAALLRYAGGEPLEELHEELQVPDRIVITYINRQGTRRHLTDEDNRGLINAMEELVERKNAEGGDWEFNDVHAEQLTLDEQVRVAGRSTIMLGVLMKPTRVSAVIEIFILMWTSRSLGMRHYSVWNDTYFTHPHEPTLPNYPDGFHGPNIPVDGRVVARLIEEHVDAREAGQPMDDFSPVHDKHED